MARISRNQLGFDVAALVSLRGTCLRLQVGAVIILEGRPLAWGYNGAPAGMPHCTPEMCNPMKPCTRSAHAEANAIAFAARKGIPLEGATMYCTDSPCNTCAKLIINSGIKGFRYLREYRDVTPLVLLFAAGIELWHESTQIDYNAPQS